MLQRSMDETDEVLITAAQNGDHFAFETLVRRHTPGVYSFIRRLTSSGENVEDLTQETFIKAWRGLRRFKTGAKFQPWLFTIARNTATDYLRKKKPVMFSEMRDEDEAPFEESLATTEPDAEAVFIAEENADVLENALSKIAPLYREILAYRYQEGMTFEEAATILGLSINTVKSRGRRALAALRKVLHLKP